MQMHFYYLTYFFYLQGAEFELDNIKKLSKEYAEAKELAFAGAWPLVTCVLHFLHVCANFELYSLEHWFEPVAIQLPLLSTLTEQDKPSTSKMLSTSFRVIDR